MVVALLRDIGNIGVRAFAGAFFIDIRIQYLTVNIPYAIRRKIMKIRSMDDSIGVGMRHPRRDEAQPAVCGTAAVFIQNTDGTEIAAILNIDLIVVAGKRGLVLKCGQQSIAEGTDLAGGFCRTE